jgi:hypothetical protein
MMLREAVSKLALIDYRFSDTVKPAMGKLEFPGRSPSVPGAQLLADKGIDMMICKEVGQCRSGHPSHGISES